MREREAPSGRAAGEEVLGAADWTSGFVFDEIATSWKKSVWEDDGKPSGDGDYVA